jgi:NAD(P)-dependent dehydrogenase (short-subunit alcohol dehydrogenase family)
MPIEGRVAVVTGGGRGIGRAAALALAGMGATVAVLARTVVEIEETAELVAAGGGEALPIEADVSDERAVEAAFTQVQRECGSITILVNNAGIGGGHKPVAELDAAEWRRIVDVDLTGAFLCARAAWPDMAEAGWGRIVNVSSSAAANGLPRFGPVAVAKAGLDHLTRIMAAEGKPQGIAVTALYPGLVDTRLQEEARAGGVTENGPVLQAMFDRYKTRGLLVPPETPARLIAYLCSDESARLSGRVLTPEGVNEAMGT